MDKNSIIKSLKGLDDEKVGFSLKLPVSLKNELQDLCEKENISMNALIVATIQSFINDDCGQQTKEMKKLLLNCRDIMNDNINEINNSYNYEYGDNEKIDMKYDRYISLINSVNKILGV